MEQGKCLVWENKDKRQIVFLGLDKPNWGVVIHSDSLVSVGTMVNLQDYRDLKPYVGTVHIKSEANN